MMQFKEKGRKFRDEIQKLVVFQAKNITGSDLKKILH